MTAMTIAMARQMRIFQDVCNTAKQARIAPSSSPPAREAGAIASAKRMTPALTHFGATPTLGSVYPALQEPSVQNKKNATAKTTTATNKSTKAFLNLNKPATYPTNRANV